MRPILLIAITSGLVGCTVKDPPPIEGTWVEDFERSEIGKNYRPTADNYTITNGALSAKGAFNHPLWLRKKLPANAIIELDCWSNSKDGDIKIELYGDGSSYAVDKGQYTSTGYVAVFGGWNNSKSILAKGNEHGSEIVTRTTPKVEVGKRYHWKLIRHDGKLEWFIDDMEQPFLTLEDPQPLSGPGNAYFGINNWQSDSWFDNVTITPL